MRITNKEILPKKEITKTFNVSSPSLKNKGLSKSLSKPIKIADCNTDSPKKKMKELKVIKEVVKKKK